MSPTKSTADKRFYFMKKKKKVRKKNIMGNFSHSEKNLSCIFSGPNFSYIWQF